MTVNTTNSQVQYVGNGVSTVFAINYQFYSKDDIVVTYDDVIQAPGGYTVTGGKGNPGTITFHNPPPAGVDVIISRVLPLIQQATFTRNEPFPSATHEIALDRIVMMIQQTIAGTGGPGSGTPEMVQDIVADMFGDTGHSGITFTYDDASGTISATVLPQGIDDAPSNGVYYVRRNGQWIEMNWNDIANKPATFPPTAHSHISTDLTDFVESVQDTVAPMFLHSGHLNISYTYDDVTGQITSVSSAGSVDDAGTWLWDETNAMTNPGTGKVRGNNALLSACTSFVISHTDATGAFRNIFALTPGATLIFSNANQATPGKYTITAITPNTGFTTFVVTADTAYTTGDPVANDPMTIGGVASGGGTGGGGVPEAPNDGVVYGRGQLDWRKVPFGDLSGVPSAFPPTTHSHVIADTTGLQPALDAKVGEAPNDGNQYARKNLAWARTTGGATVSDTPPASPQAGQMWWESDSGNMYVYYSDADSSQWVQVSGLVSQSPVSQPRNRIVNGAMQISQENGETSNAAAANGTYYLADQWLQAWDLTGNITGNRVTAPLTVGGFAIVTNVASATPTPAANAHYHLVQRIEGINLTDFKWGTANAKQIVLRFNCKSNIAGTFSVYIKNAVPDRTFLTPFTITAINTWQVITCVIPGDTTGTWPIDSSLGMSVGIGLASGTTHGGGVAGWQAGSKIQIAGNTNLAATSGNNFSISDVGLYLDETNTGVAPRWELPNYANELIACQRYYRQITNLLTGGYGLAGNNVWNYWPLSPVTRINPAVTFGGISYNNGSALTDNGSDANTIATKITSIAQGLAYAVYYARINARM